MHRCERSYNRTGTEWHNRCSDAGLEYDMNDWHASAPCMQSFLHQRQDVCDDDAVGICGGTVAAYRGALRCQGDRSALKTRVG